MQMVLHLCKLFNQLVPSLKLVCSEVLLFENVLLQDVLVDTSHFKFNYNFNQISLLTYQFKLIKQMTDSLTVMSLYRRR